MIVSKKIPISVVWLVVMGFFSNVALGQGSAPRTIHVGDNKISLQAKAVNQIAILATDIDRPHIVLQFSSPLNATQKITLTHSGLKLLNYLGDNAYFVAIQSPTFSKETLSRVGSLTGGYAISTNQKLHPFLAAGNRAEWAIVSDNTIAVPIVAMYVLFHADVQENLAGRRAVLRHGGVIRDQIRSVNGLVIEIPESSILPLASEDIVQYLEPALPPLEGVNNGNRALTGAETVQSAPYNLDGSGVTAMIYDAGRALSSHVDYGGRLVDGDLSIVADHPTHVACTLGGSGAASGGLYRGMAPGVDILSYGFQATICSISGEGCTVNADCPGGEICVLPAGDPLYTNPGDLESDYAKALALGADIANNSIGTNACANGLPCDITGDYGATSALIDSIITGSLGAPMRIFWANGNERACTRCQLEGVTTVDGYHSTAPPSCSKNPVAVGAVSSNADAIAFFTSFGPCDDGRLKPDIVAPGAQTDGDLGVTSCSANGITLYSVKQGTSMATPTVTGLAALMVQDFRNQFPSKPDPLNSTIKALLIHNAVDIGNTGPDYQSGYGSVRIQPTIDFLRSGSFLEDSVTNLGTQTIFLNVNAGDPQLKISLVWDDAAGTPNAAIALVNNLDLVVTSPTLIQHFPWTLDPLNPSLPAVQTQTDSLNNVEQVVVNAPEVGLWRIDVVGTNLPSGTQTYSLTATPALPACSSAGTVSVDREAYGCDSAMVIDVADCDGNTNDTVAETLTVTITSTTESAPGEVVTLTETSVNSGVFRGSINVNSTNSVGVLKVSHGGTITASYLDADDGAGGFNVTVSALAPVDCLSALITNIQTIPASEWVDVTFTTDEPTSGTIRYGTSCASLTDAAIENTRTLSHAQTITGLTEQTTYFYAVDATDAAGNVTTDDNLGTCFTFTTLLAPNYFTERFTDNDNDLDFQSITFTPSGTLNFYSSCINTITDLSVNPAGGTPFSMTDDSSRLVTITSGQSFSLYGIAYTDFFVGSNGYVTFTAGDAIAAETLSNHFDLPRISVFFDDLNPATLGTVSWQQLSDRMVVTWLDVPELASSNSNTFQLEMFFSGTIRMTYLTLAATDGLAGLSEGLGIPGDFVENNFTVGSPTCNNTMMDVTVQLEGIDTATTRDVTFVITDCVAALSETTTLPVSFDATGIGIVGLTTTLTNPIWISADEGHTLRRLQALPFPLPANLSFTNANRLITGDFSGDGLIDVVDFSILASRWSLIGTTADINGDNFQSTADFTALTINILKQSDPLDACVP